MARALAKTRPSQLGHVLLCSEVPCRQPRVHCILNTHKYKTDSMKLENSSLVDVGLQGGPARAYSDLHSISGSCCGIGAGGQMFDDVLCDT